MNMRRQIEQQHAGASERPLPTVTEADFEAYAQDYDYARARVHFGIKDPDQQIIDNPVVRVGDVRSQTEIIDNKPAETTPVTNDIGELSDEPPDSEIIVPEYVPSDDSAEGPEQDQNLKHPGKKGIEKLEPTPSEHYPSDESLAALAQTAFGADEYDVPAGTEVPIPVDLSEKALEYERQIQDAIAYANAHNIPIVLHGPKADYKSVGKFLGTALGDALRDKVITSKDFKFFADKYVVPDQVPIEANPFGREEAIPLPSEDRGAVNPPKRKSKPRTGDPSAINPAGVYSDFQLRAAGEHREAS